MPWSELMSQSQFFYNVNQFISSPNRPLRVPQILSPGMLIYVQSSGFDKTHYPRSSQPAEAWQNKDGKHSKARGQSFQNSSFWADFSNTTHSGIQRVFRHMHNIFNPQDYPVFSVLVFQTLYKMGLERKKGGKLSSIVLLFYKYSLAWINVTRFLHLCKFLLLTNDIIVTIMNTW